MIEFKKFILDNGMKVIIQEDFSTPLVAVNTLYNVGSRDEDPELTGLAHLFEHLMFSGSANIPEYDTPLQLAGGENNAFTNNDITNYYLTIPSANIETAFWLESDRMKGLNFNKQNLDIQKRVVTEEFKQRYLNQPYGDIMLNLRPLAYTAHPYMWSTIGKDISHIEKVTLDEVRSFFFSHYAPNNAILTVSGNIRERDALDLAVKWFSEVPPCKIAKRYIPQEPEQPEPRYLTLRRKVPASVIYKAWHICGRNESDFMALDLLTDLLSGGESGRLYENLVREKKLFSDVNAYLSGDIDPGLMIIYGRLMEGTEMAEAERAILASIEEITSIKAPPDEMQKIKNKFEANAVFSNTGILYKAMTISYYELLGDASLINEEVSRYRKISPEIVRSVAEKYLRENNCSTLYYLSDIKD